MQIKTTIYATSHSIGWLESQRQTNTSIGENVEKLGPSNIADGNVKWCSHCGEQFSSYSTITHRVTVRSSNFMPRYKPKRIGSICPYTSLHMNVLRSIIRNSQ